MNAEHAHPLSFAQLGEVLVEAIGPVATHARRGQRARLELRR